jgi:hypothetical protein
LSRWFLVSTSKAAPATILLLSTFFESLTSRLLVSKPTRATEFLSTFLEAFTRIFFESASTSKLLATPESGPASKAAASELFPSLLYCFLSFFKTLTEPLPSPSEPSTKSLPPLFQALSESLPTALKSSSKATTEFFTSLFKPLLAVLLLMMLAMLSASRVIISTVLILLDVCFMITSSVSSLTFLPCLSFDYTAGLLINPFVCLFIASPIRWLHLSALFEACSTSGARLLIALIIGLLSPARKSGLGVLGLCILITAVSKFGVLLLIATLWCISLTCVALGLCLRVVTKNTTQKRPS